jgi:hypothetical protein
VYFPPLVGARDVVVDFTVVVVRVVDAAGADGGGGDAARDADAVVLGVDVDGALSVAVDATAAVSEPWQRCIQKSIWLRCSTWAGELLCAASARLRHAAGVWFLSKYTRAIQNDARARDGLAG